MKFKRINNYFHITGYWMATFLAITFSHPANAQSPTHLPRTKPEPVGFFDSIENMVFYIIIPLIIAILYFVWKRHLARQKDREEENQNN